MAVRSALLLILISTGLVVAAPKDRALSATSGQLCFHAAGTGWRFTICIHQANTLGVIGSARWHGRLPGVLGRSIQHPQFMAAPPNPSPVLGLYGPFADTASYELAIGWPDLRFILWNAKTCVPNCAASRGTWMLALGSTKPQPGGMRMAPGQ